MIHFNNEFGEVFYINPIVRDIKHKIEDLHYNNHLENDETAIDFNAFYELLTEEQKLFFDSKVAYKKLDVLEDEYNDFIETINEYLHMLLIQNLEEEIRNAPTIVEKIKLAEYRDVSNKEVKNGQK